MVSSHSLQVSDLNAGYGRHAVLYDINLGVRSGEIVAVVGPNGSGKSTLLKSISGLATIYSGRVSLDGENLTKLPPHEIARKGVVYLPQVENIFPSLTLRENLMMAGYTLEGDELRERTKEALEIFPALKPHLGRRSETLSGGERRMLAMAMALVRKPKIIMLDEPTGDLAPKVAMEVLSKVTELRDEFEMAIVIVEQNARRALEISDRAHLLVGGRCVFEGGAKNLLERPDFGKLYLGVAGS